MVRLGKLRAKTIRYTLLLLSLAAIVSLNFVAAEMVDENIGKISITPLRNEIAIQPGSTYQDKIKVTNGSGSNIRITMSVEEFGVLNEQYDYIFEEDADLANWVNFSDSNIELKPGQFKEIDYRIGVPISAEPGGRYVSLFASSDIIENGAITTRQRVGSLLYITVQGDVTRDGRLLSLSSPWLVLDNSDWSVNIQNTGTTHFRSEYSVSVRDIFDNQINYSSNDKLILPSTIRLVAGKFSLPIWPGIYKIVYAVSLGDKPSYKNTIYFIYLPFWSWGLSGLIVVYRVLIKKRKMIKKL
ncbi:hypothetical protein HGB24_02610 [Candidatus Saccharibacteria bacterium]|nr:hypothetical protein [Candidatus Saccharibacteria bacterium]